MINSSIIFPQTTSFRFGQGWVASILLLGSNF
jgi:hypothetical protein